MSRVSAPLVPAAAPLGHLRTSSDSHPDHSRTSSHLNHPNSKDPHHKDLHAKQHADPHHKKNSNIGLIICGIIILLILIVIIYFLALLPTMSITKKNITATGNLTVDSNATVTNNLTVNGTLTAKTFASEVNLDNVACDNITVSDTVTCDNITVSDTLTIGPNSITGASSNAYAGYPVTTINSELTVGGAISMYCGSTNNANYGGTTLLSESGLYFCRNLSGGNNEIDMVAINNYNYSASNSTAPVLNIYISNVEILSPGAQTSTIGYVEPLITMLANYTVTINGYLVVTGSVTAYTVIANGVTLSSDYRLKEEIQPISDEYSIDKLKPCSYLLKDDESKTIQTGFIAHELQEIFPHLVNGEKDGEKMQSVNYMGLIAILTKELQSLKSIVAELKTDNIMLKNKIIELENK